MFQNIVENKFYSLSLGFLLALLVSLMIQQIYYLIGALLLVFLLFKFKSDLIPLTITFLLIFVSDINTGLRNFITAGGFIVITFYFIKKYGLLYKKYPRFPYWIELYFIFLFSVMIISSLLSDLILTSLIEVFRLTFFVILIYLLYALLRDIEDIYKYIYALIAAGSILSLSIWFNFFYSDVPVYLFQKGVIQEGGIIKNVSAAGGMLAVSIPLNFALIFSTAKNRKKNFLVSLFIFQIVALLLTNSRAAILAVVISIGFIHYFLAGKYFKRTLIIIGAVLTVLFFAAPSIFQLVLLYLRVDRVFENTRYYLWDIAISIFKDHPVIGTGPGMFKEYIYNYLPVRLNGWDEQQIEWIYLNAGIGHAHNFFLFYLSELGFIGFIAALLLPVLFTSFSYKVSRLVGVNSSLYAVVIGITGMGLGLFVRSLFESTGLLTYGWITRDLPFWICFIVIFFLFQQFQKKSRTNYT